MPLSLHITRTRAKTLGVLLVGPLFLVGCGGVNPDKTDEARAHRLNSACGLGEGTPVNFDFRTSKIVVTCERFDGFRWQVITDEHGYGAP